MPSIERSRADRRFHVARLLAPSGLDRARPGLGRWVCDAAHVQPAVGRL